MNLIPARAQFKFYAEHRKPINKFLKMNHYRFRNLLAFIERKRTAQS